MAFEAIGLGCGSGPLTGRYNPPLGGALYFLRPGTTKMPLFRRMPVLGGIAYTIADAATGVIEGGKVNVNELRKLQPWPDSNRWPSWG